MSTVRDLVTDSLRLVGVVASGETPTASELADGTKSLRRMLQSWSSQGLAIPVHAREVFLLEPGKAKYTMGPGGDFDTIKPAFIDVVKATTPDIEQVMTDPGSPEIPGDPGDPLADPPIPPTDPIPEVPPTYEQVVHSTLEMDVEILPNVSRWADISLKTTQSTIVTQVFVEGTAPLETINCWPVPSTQGALVIYSKKTLDTVVDANTEIALPEGYEDAIVYNLAKRMCPEFGKAVDPDLREDARRSLATVKIKNSRAVLMRSDAYGLQDKNGKRGFNILTGYYR